MSLLLVLVLLLTPSYVKAQKPPETEHPPLGQLIDVGGYRVHLFCIGSGSPTVVITGAGYSFDWGLVQPEVAKTTQVCAYDHSGIAWSDPGPTDSCSLRVAEIHAALTNAKIPGPYVLVGHSVGALVSRLYASGYPGEVAGMVIVDHALSTGLFSPRKTSPSAAPLPPGGLRLNPDLAFEKLPARDYQLHLWANSLPGVSKIMARNIAMQPECASDLEAATRNQTSPLGGKPLVVISTSNSMPAYADLQRQLPSLSSNSKRVVAEKSSHFIMIDRPDLVIRAIHDVVEAAQNHSQLKNPKPTAD
jgi:pimeloyl-ACP methyl ester carboxylesterase